MCQILVVAHGIFSCGKQTQLWHVGSSSLTRNWTWAPCIESLSHWTTREVPTSPIAKSNTCTCLLHNYTPHLTNELQFINFFRSIHLHWAPAPMWQALGEVLRTGLRSRHVSSKTHCCHQALLLPALHSRHCLCTHACSSTETSSLLISANVRFSSPLKTLLKCRLPTCAPHVEIASGSPGRSALHRRLEDL